MYIYVIVDVCKHEHVYGIEVCKRYMGVDVYKEYQLCRHRNMSTFIGVYP